jgi:excisionase family DNA binding protein
MTKPALCYTRQEVAELLKVDPDAVNNLISRGELRAVTVGGDLRIPARNLDAFLVPRETWMGLAPRWRWAMAAMLCTGVLMAGSSVLAEIVAPGNESSGIPYEGFLERNGTPVEGPVSVRATLSDPSAASAPIVYEETQDVVVSAGRFALVIGMGARTTLGTLPFGDAVGTQNGLALALAVKTAADSDYVSLGGVQRLGSTPYALRAAPGHAFHADQFHTNGLGQGQMFLDGARIEANGPIQVGTGAAAGMGVVDVNFGGTVRAPAVSAGTVSATGQLVAGTSVRFPDGTTQVTGATSTAVVVYQCPSGAVACTNGSWGSFGCQGQISTSSVCTNITYPCTENRPCTRLGVLMVGQ